MIDDLTVNSGHACISRRNFLLAGASTIITLACPNMSNAMQLLVKEYPQINIGSVNQLKQDQPIDFTYPPNNPASTFTLIKLGERAGGGVGRQHDIVAFSNFCSHMGGALNGTYKAKHKAMGPCPLHLTTFDLTRYGMVISGHATESLPQARLAIRGNAIYVTGVMGLIYG